MDQGNLDASSLQHSLRGISSPAEKEEVASTAESNNAPQDMVRARLGTPTQKASEAPRRLCKRSKAASTLGE